MHTSSRQKKEVSVVACKIPNRGGSLTCQTRHLCRQLQAPLRLERFSVLDTHLVAPEFRWSQCSSCKRSCNTFLCECASVGGATWKLWSPSPTRRPIDQLFALSIPRPSSRHTTRCLLLPLSQLKPLRSRLRQWTARVSSAIDVTGGNNACVELRFEATLFH